MPPAASSGVAAQIRKGPTEVTTILGDERVASPLTDNDIGVLVADADTANPKITITKEVPSPSGLLAERFPSSASSLDKVSAGSLEQVKPVYPKQGVEPTSQRVSSPLDEASSRYLKDYYREKARVHKVISELSASEIDNIEGMLAKAETINLTQAQRLKRASPQLLKKILSQNFYLSSDDYMYVAAVIGGGKPCSYINVSKPGKRFFLRQAKALRELGVGIIIDEPPNGIKEYFGAVYFPLHIFNYELVQKVIVDNLDLLRENGFYKASKNMSDIEIEQFISSFGYQKTLDLSRTDLVGLFYGYPREAVKAKMGRSKLISEKERTAYEEKVDTIGLIILLRVLFPAVRPLSDFEKYEVINNLFDWLRVLIKPLYSSNPGITDKNKLAPFSSYLTTPASLVESVQAALRAKIGFNTVISVLQDYPLI